MKKRHLRFWTSIPHIVLMVLYKMANRRSSFSIFCCLLQHKSKNIVYLCDICSFICFLQYFNFAASRESYFQTVIPIIHIILNA